MDTNNNSPSLQTEEIAPDIRAMIMEIHDYITELKMIMTNTLLMFSSTEEPSRCCLMFRKQPSADGVPAACCPIPLVPAESLTTDSKMYSLP